MAKTFENPDFACYVKVKEDNTIEEIFVVNLLESEDETARLNTCVNAYGEGNWIRVELGTVNHKFTYDPATDSFIAPPAPVEEPVAEVTE